MVRLPPQPADFLAMGDTGEKWRTDFEQAMGESFGDAVDSQDASAQECCEVIRAFLDNTMTPRSLAQLTEAQVVALSRKFGEYFECESPSATKINDAIARTLARWPIGSLGE